MILLIAGFFKLCRLQLVAVALTVDRAVRLPGQGRFRFCVQGTFSLCQGLHLLTLKFEICDRQHGYSFLETGFPLEATRRFERGHREKASWYEEQEGLGSTDLGSVSAGSSTLWSWRFWALFCGMLLLKLLSGDCGHCSVS